MTNWSVFFLCGIIILSNSIEASRKSSEEKLNVKINKEPEGDNPEYLSNGKNVVGPEAIYIGK